MDCAVCLCPTTDAVRPCDHPVCDACLHAWLARGQHTCPLCRGAVVPRAPPHKAKRVRVVDFPAPDAHAGITLADARGGGVRVVRLHGADRAARCGVRVGDVITHINGVPTRGHRAAVAVTDRATQARLPIAYTLRARWWA